MLELITMEPRQPQLRVLEVTRDNYEEVAKFINSGYIEVHKNPDMEDIPGNWKRVVFHMPNQDPEEIRITFQTTKHPQHDRHFIAQTEDGVWNEIDEKLLSKNWEEINMEVIADGELVE